MRKKVKKTKQDEAPKPRKRRKVAAGQLKADVEMVVAVQIITISVEEKVRRIKRQLEGRGYACSVLFEDAIAGRVCDYRKKGKIVHKASKEVRASVTGYFDHCADGHWKGNNFRITTKDREIIDVLQQLGGEFDVLKEFGGKKV
jgi:hypothetical protein